MKRKVTASPRGGVGSNRTRTCGPQEDEPDSAACRGEPASVWRSLERAGRAVVTVKATFGRMTWLGAGRRDGRAEEAERSVGFGASPAEVRALIVPKRLRPRERRAAKPGRGKAGQEGGCAMAAARKRAPTVPFGARRDAEVHARVWTASERPCGARGAGAGNGVNAGHTRVLRRDDPVLRPEWDRARRVTPPMRKPPTGEPYAGKPPVRFGGRGGRQPFPTPIRK
jgi:hypothetical protein